MKKRIQQTVTIITVALLVSMALPATALSVVDPIEGQVTTDPAQQLSPAISGDRMVWKDFRNGNYDIYLYDLAAGEELAVCTDGSIQQNPAISGRRVVWQDFRNGNWDIYLYDVVTGVETQITTDRSAQQNPVIDGTRIAWEDFRNGNWDVYYLDVGVGTETRVTYDDGRQRSIGLSGDRIVWEDNRDGDWDIWLLDTNIGENAVLTVSDVDECKPDIAGDQVVWETFANGNWDIALYDFGTGTTTMITDDPTTQTGAQIAKTALVWQDYRNGNWDIYLYDLSSDSEKQITTDAAPQWTADSDGGDIVWEDHRNGNGDIYMARLAAAVGRSAGDDRYDTASTGISTNWPEGAETVVLATGTGYADALAASGLAGALDAPLLLTRQDGLPQTVSDEIEALGAASAIIVGGERAVGPAVEDALEALGLDVERVAGTDRYETGRLVATRMAAALGAGLSETAFVVRGDAFADALAVAPFAYNAGIPVVLTTPDVLCTDARRTLADLNITDAIVVGGTGALSEAVEAALTMASVRVAGTDRYETAVEVAEFATGEGWGEWTFLGIATGADFPDALSGGAITGHNGGVLLMTPRDSLHPAVRQVVEDHITAVESVQLFGGANVLSDTVALQLAALW